ncbi:MAG TPA: uroporphyrinogen decarboxylase [Caulobacteraceae bacterium]|nr:uroporphyrinogen decarboxylase [Caulobacteraceae bacterium]
MEPLLAAKEPSIVRVLRGAVVQPTPVWFMRQAGRALPEYRELRSRAKDFISFCLDPEMASEASLQPVRRFDFDAAIIFADILLTPAALGQKVWFEAGEGPRLGPLPDLAQLEAAVAAVAVRLSPVGETIRRVRGCLHESKTVIGFAGGPWTVATYMLEGRSSDRSHARALAIEQPEFVDRLVDILTEATALYLAMQADAGAQVLQIFESWAEQLAEDVFERLVIRPHSRILLRLQELGLTTPVIGFPRGAGASVLEYGRRSGVQGVGLDVQATARMGLKLQERLAIQGNLDPLLLRAGGKLLDRRVGELLAQWGGGPYVFNLGHGVLPDTPLDHIAQVVARVKAA